MRPPNAVFQILLCAVALAIAAPPARAQGSGKFERTQPSAPVTPAAPSKPDKFVAELRRKAAANESDNGFCASVPWPQHGNDMVPQLYRFYDRAAKGAMFTTKNTPYGCGVLQVTAIGTAIGRGGRCVAFFWTQCHNGDCKQFETAYACKNNAIGAPYEENFNTCKCQ